MSNESSFKTTITVAAIGAVVCLAYYAYLGSSPHENESSTASLSSVTKVQSAQISAPQYPANLPVNKAPQLPIANSKNSIAAPANTMAKVKNEEFTPPENLKALAERQKDALESPNQAERTLEAYKTCLERPDDAEFKGLQTYCLRWSRILGIKHPLLQSKVNEIEKVAAAAKIQATVTSTAPVYGLTSDSTR